MKNNNIKIINLAHDIDLPKYATESSAGVDLHANIGNNNQIILKPFARELIPTGIKIALPDNYMAQITPRSGLALKYGITILNSPGIIDTDYRGEIKIILINLSNENFIINHGDRIAQMIFVPYMTANFTLSDNLEDTNRGEKGFGSTGI